MKKLFLSLLSLVMTMAIFAQTESVRTIRMYYDGSVIFTRDVNLVDSMNFAWREGAGSDDDITGGEVDPTKQLYVGAVAFNQNVRQMAITSDMEAVKAFINEQTNDKDFTAFAYSVSKGNKQFDAPELPDFDHVFMLNFSDGTDNYSNMKWGEEGRIVNNNFAYDTARYDLSSRLGLNSYAIGFGAKEADFREKMKKIVMGSGSYYAAASSSDLQPTFNEIAKSMLASAKNVLLKTNPGYYVGFYKYFRLSFLAEDGSTDYIYAQMDGTPTTGYTLSISKINNGYAYFDAPAQGVVDDETGKVHIPLNNLKFVKGGKELQYKFTIEVSFDGESYYEDVEEASTAEEISKRIAVVLVLDCSTSMGDAFEPMKAAAIEFIKTMEKMEVDDSDPNIPDPTPNPDVTGKTIYLVPNDWALDNAALFIYSWGGAADIAGKMTKVSDNLYSYVIGNNTNCLFVRQSSDLGESINWVQKWNQTADLTIPSGQNCYTITGWGPNDGTWSIYSAGDPVPNPNTGNHEYVDLGLSVKWATCNVGATKPEEYGDYFAWGETQPKSTYDWSTYKWCNGSYDTQTKYNTNSSYGTVDNKTTLDLSDDAARANWGGSWRMPTDAELTELREQCTWTWTTQNGVYGYKVTSKKSGYMNKSIFLPAAGYRLDSSLLGAGSYGDYWSSSLSTDYPYYAWDVSFSSYSVGRDHYSRYYGFSVRPVCQ